MKNLKVIRRRDTTDEIMETIARAVLRADECDSVLIIMQKKGEDGMLWFAPDSGRVETASFMATGFLHWLHSLKGSK